MKSCLIRLSYNENFEIDILKKTLCDGKKIIIISDFPTTDEPFINFISALGKPLIETRNKDRKAIFEVKVVGSNNVFPSFANSNLDFPLHTDCANFEKIPNAVALLCVRQAAQGGASIFALLSDIMENISEDLKAFLLSKSFHFGKQFRPILNLDNEHFRINYSRMILEYYSKLSEREINLLNQFEDLIYEHSFQFKLQPNELILFRNDLVLHGRTDFNLTADRLLKRVRFDGLCE